MRNYFTISISDVHGTRHYSFKHFFKRFAWLIVGVFMLIWIAGGFSLWWLAFEAEKIEEENRIKLEAYNESLMKLQTDYEDLLEERNSIEEALSQKSAQIEFLDSSLQNLEELVGIDAEEPENLPYQERVKQVQLNSLGKSIMMDMVPSGHAIADYRGLTSKYGYRIHPIRKKRHMHGGIDYKSRTGDDIIATADGVVSYSAYNKASGFGNLVTIVHANGFKTRYGHLSQRSVKAGQIVRKGQKIGEVGSTGRSSGPHLHYEVWFLHHRLNPGPFDKWTIEKYDDIFEKVKGVPWASLSQNVNQIVQKVERQLLLKVATSTAK